MLDRGKRMRNTRLEQRGARTACSIEYAPGDKDNARSSYPNIRQLASGSSISQSIHVLSSTTEQAEGYTLHRRVDNPGLFVVRDVILAINMQDCQTLERTGATHNAGDIDCGRKNEASWAPVPQPLARLVC